MSFGFVSSFLNQIVRFLASLRRPDNFFFYVVPFSVVLGRVAPASWADAFNDVGMSLVQLIAFPAMPLVLSAVMISMANIFSINQSSSDQCRRFSSRFFCSLVGAVLLTALLAVMLSAYQGAGELSPDGKLSIGRFMLDSSDIHISRIPDPGGLASDFWIAKLIPANLLADASQERTIRVITGSILAGLAMSRLGSSVTEPLMLFLRSINSIAIQVLNIVLNLAPLVLVCLIAGAVSRVNAEIVVALLNLTICVFLAALVSLGMARLIFRRFTSTHERDSLSSHPIDSVFLLSLSTGSSMSSYSLMYESLKAMGRNEAEVEASSSLSLLVACLGNVSYNVIAIVFALNLYGVSLTPLRMIEVIGLGVFTGISAAGLTGVAIAPTLGLALTYFQVPAAPVLALLLAVEPILTLPRAATTSVLAMAIAVVSASRACSDAGHDSSLDSGGPVDIARLNPASNALDPD